jgi:molybdopterin molybdotransferase
VIASLESTSGSRTAGRAAGGQVASFEEARKAIIEQVSVLGSELTSLLDSTGRVLAQDVSVPWDLPAWDNSAMDGYAVRSAEATRFPASWRLAGYIPAGVVSPEALARGTAAKIMTGAPIPAGADAVVPAEEAEERGGAVFVTRPVPSGAHVRRRGEDFQAGEVMLEAGTVLGAAEVSVLACFDRLQVAVVRRPRVAILSTGDELASPGERLAPGKIHDSNGLALAAAVKELGAEPSLLGIAPDEKASLRALLSAGLRADALVTTAGVAAGDRDLVREVLLDLGAREVFWKVDVKPGRPMAFAMSGSTPIFSLPGNPVSALLTFEEFARPALLRMMGRRKLFRPAVRAVLQEGVRTRPGRVSLVRVRLERREGALLASSAGHQGAGRQRTTLQAHGIARVDSEAGWVEAGTPVDVDVLTGDFE